jgi:hypothetical protein
MDFNTAAETTLTLDLPRTDVNAIPHVTVTKQIL